MLSQKEKHQLKTYCESNSELASILQHLEASHRMEISQISHEIRNPVTLINSYLQLTQTQHPEVSDFSTWTPLTENMTYLKILLEDLSLYNNSCTLHKSSVSLSKLLTDLQTDYHNTHPDLAITLQITGPIPYGCFDQIKLRSVFSNIIRNAIEAPCGDCKKEIILSLTYSDCFHITIANNGLPIPEEHISSLFDPFVTHKSDGTGLGLAIVKNIIDSHNGTVFVESTKELTCFKIHLPLYLD